MPVRQAYGAERHGKKYVCGVCIVIPFCVSPANATLLYKFVRMGPVGMARQAAGNNHPSSHARPSMMMAHGTTSKLPAADAAATAVEYSCEYVCVLSCALCRHAHAFDILCTKANHRHNNMSAERFAGRANQRN